MTEPAARHLAAALATVVVLALSACTPPTEHLLLERFFAASRLRDRTALSRFATIVFEPQERGTVSSFAVNSVKAGRASPAGAPPEDVRRIAAISLADPFDPRDIPLNGISLVSREVGIDATVRRPDGVVTHQRMVVVIQKALAAGSPDRRGLWVVTDIR